MESILSAKNITIGYDSDLIKEISLSVKQGSITTLIGPNGCGKSTLLKSVSGLLDIRGGLIYLSSKDMSDMKADEIAQKMSMVMTTAIKPERMTCREVIETGRYPYTGMLGILSDHDKEIVDKAIMMTDTSDIKECQFTNISDGQRQRVMLARAICQEPKVLILDEPTSYLDIRYKLDILEKIRLLAKQNDIAVLMSLHELDIAMQISDTVIAIGDNRIQKIGKPKEIFKEDFIRKLYGIEGADISLIGSRLWLDESKDMPCIDSSFKQSGKAKVLMIQGTMSNAGKSIIAAGLCRILTQDGYRVAPFKSQNMALNSYVTEEGLEMGRAQVVQAECCKIRPLSCMNPILLKPTDDVGSQVIVNGKAVGNMKAADYFRYKTKLIPEIKKAYEKLSETVDIIIVEGAGSPVELNLKSDDIVNMGLAKMIDAPVILVGDIDRGGVFAQLIGTIDLLTDEERSRVKGLIVNKFRGDRALFDDGVRILKEKGNTPVVGVVPYMDIRIDDEDSLSEKLYVNHNGAIDIAVIKLPHIANFTDFDVFDQIPDVSVRYVTKAEELCQPDMMILPGSKNTIGDLRWIREEGFEDKIRELYKNGTIIFGICGGYQILGRNISDPYDTEGGKSDIGLNLLAVDTVMEKEKVRTLFEGSVTDAGKDLKALKGCHVSGYEIHTGKSVPYEDLKEFTSDSTGYFCENIYGTYIHGIFDSKEIFTGIIDTLAKKKGISIDLKKAMDQKSFKETQYDRLADVLRESLDIEMIYDILGLHKSNEGQV
ncbi:MAG: cobyric acid synthase [Lachnospiraceae bacterium]|nr:cobyric acid synthase [Lachnospiraceae bacterium]